MPATPPPKLPPNEAPHIVAEDLVQSFLIGERKIEVLRGLSFTAQRGERIFLQGASGAGKTTLLYTLAGLERPTSGRVLLGGVSLYDMRGERLATLRNRVMGYVFQSFFLLPEMTATENVMLPGRIAGKVNRKRAAELLELVGLGHRLNHLPAELSGGEQQRVAIARALANDPEILFADEPTGNLDSKTGAEIMHLLLSIADASKKTLIVVTHDPKLAGLGDRNLMLQEGRLAD
ncbi:MAG: ABC transporter ATP-binding protein [Verrucomicrobiales bacterium]